MTYGGYEVFAVQAVTGGSGAEKLESSIPRKGAGLGLPLVLLRPPYCTQNSNTVSIA